MVHRSHAPTNSRTLSPAAAVGPRFVLPTSGVIATIGAPVYCQLLERFQVCSLDPCILTRSAVTPPARGTCCYVDDSHIFSFTALYASEVRPPTYGAGKAIRFACRSPPQHRQHGKVSILSARHRLARDSSASLVAACVCRSGSAFTQPACRRSQVRCPCRTLAMEDLMNVATATEDPATLLG